MSSCRSQSLRSALSRRRPLESQPAVSAPRSSRSDSEFADLHWPDLELEAVSGTVANAIFEGKCIQLELLGAETGKLRGKFPLRISLSVEAARALAESLKKLADQAENTAFQA